MRISEKGTRARLELRDIRSGALIGPIDEVPRYGNSAFLSDGRLIIASIVQGRAILKIYTVDGIEQRTLALGQAKGIRLGGEVAPAQFVVSTSATDAKVGVIGDHQLSLVDISSGGVKPLGSKTLGLWPAVVQSRMRANQPPAPGSIATKLFYRAGSVIVFDPLTGEQKRIAGKERQ